jgi:hypothetical protein
MDGGRRDGDGRALRPRDRRVVSDRERRRTSGAPEARRGLDRDPDDRVGRPAGRGRPLRSARRRSALRAPLGHLDAGLGDRRAFTPARGEHGVGRKRGDRVRRPRWVGVRQHGKPLRPRDGSLERDHDLRCAVGACGAHGGVGRLAHVRLGGQEQLLRAGRREPLRPGLGHLAAGLRRRGAPRTQACDGGLDRLAGPGLGGVPVVHGGLLRRRRPLRPVGGHVVVDVDRRCAPRPARAHRDVDGEQDDRLRRERRERERSRLRSPLRSRRRLLGRDESRTGAPSSAQRGLVRQRGHRVGRRLGDSPSGELHPAPRQRRSILPCERFVGPHLDLRERPTRRARRSHRGLDGSGNDLLGRLGRRERRRALRLRHRRVVPDRDVGGAQRALGSHRRLDRCRDDRLGRLRRVLRSLRKRRALQPGVRFMDDDVDRDGPARGRLPHRRLDGKPPTT